MSSLASYSSLSSLSHDDSNSQDDQTEDDQSEDAWLEDYDDANKSAMNSQLEQLEAQLEVLRQKVYTDSFLERIQQEDDTKQREQLENQLQQLKQSVASSLETQLVHVDHEECSHCGVVGMVHINVHRCIKHCMKCHRESAIEHFYETTGTNLMTTNPGRYTRRGHFISTLKKIQAKRPVKLPPMLLGETKKYFEVHHNVLEPKDINYKDMKDALKELGYHNKKGKGDYTDHIMAIYCQLTGRNPPRFTIPENQTLIQDFDKLDVVFERACYELGEDRRNWLSYEFTIYKLCEKNHYENMKDWFGILKGPLTLKCQDSIIGKMFEINKWPFEETKPPKEEGAHDETPLVLKPKRKEQPKILDMLSFMEHHKQFIPKPIDVFRIDDHIMSTDEEEEKKTTTRAKIKKKRKASKAFQVKEDQKLKKRRNPKHASIKPASCHQAKTGRVREQKLQAVS